MFIETPSALSFSSLLTSSDFVSQSWIGQRLHVSCRRLQTSVCVVKAHGDIDASNTNALTDYALGQLTDYRAIIIDLQHLNFFGVEGMTVLQRLTTHCANADNEWTLIPGTAVARVLALGVPQATLPVADTVDSALAAF